MYTCKVLPSNQSIYRQITSHEKGGAVRWVVVVTEYNIVVSGEDGNRVQTDFLIIGVHYDHASHTPPLSLLQLHVYVYSHLWQCDLEYNIPTYRDI